MSVYSESISQLIEQLGRLPGVGKKSAERLAFHLLRVDKQEALDLAESIRDVRENVRYCSVCYNLAEAEKCDICANESRDHTTVCIVEQPRDLMAIEQSGSFRGSYHVLLGRIAPLDGIGPDKLTIDALMDRIKTGEIKEVIMATNPTVEGDGTALYLSNLMADIDISITRLARGVTPGMVLEFANKEILADALSGRQKF